MYTLEKCTVDIRVEWYSAFSDFRKRLLGCWSDMSPTPKFSEFERTKFTFSKKNVLTQHDFIQAKMYAKQIFSLTLTTTGAAYANNKTLEAN